MILGRLAGGEDFESSLMQQLPKGSTADQIFAVVQYAAPCADDLCWVLSDWTGIDKLTVPPREAIRRVVGLGLGTVVSILPGVLAYYENEAGQQFLLRKV
jgi:hypothetical protein